MRLTTTAFADMAAIPGEFAFAVDRSRRARQAVGQSQSRFRVERTCPPGTRSLALLCHDPDVPSRGDDVNQEGRVVPASLPRVDFFHWVLDRPAAPTPRGIARGELSRRRRARGKPVRRRADGARQGVNDYTGWFAGDEDMAGDYFGYDGPCPPWNDAHRRTATCSRSTRSTCASSPSPAQFTGADVRTRDAAVTCSREASVTGRYTLNPRRQAVVDARRATRRAASPHVLRRRRRRA